MKAAPLPLAGLLAAAGTLHLAVPEPFDAIVPPPLPPRPTTLLSGVAELACAAALVVPSTRARGALATALLFVAVFPANVWMVVEPGDLPRWLLVARLPLQVPLVLWVLAVRRAARA